MYDCRQYSDNELSMIVFNDEFLYNQRHRMNEVLLSEMGIKYTSEQYTVLLDDIAEDIEQS